MDKIDVTKTMDELGRAMRALEDKQLQFDMKNRELVDRIDSLKAELKEYFMVLKESATSQCLSVQYRKGAVKWDTKWLDGFAIDHPEYNLGQYRKVSKPTVAFVLRDDAPWNEGM